MISLAEFVRTVSSSLRAHHRIDAGLNTVVEAIKATESPFTATGRALSELRKRAAALREAALELSKFTEQVEQRAATLRFTAEGWPERKVKLERDLAENEEVGLAQWLDDWFTAAASVRLSALDRLTDDVPLPEAGRALAERLRTARHAIQSRNWHQARMVLEAGIEGVEIAGMTLPAPPVRRGLRLLQLRVAIEAPADADTVKKLFDAAPYEDWSATLAALSDRCRRLRHHDLSDSHIRTATLDDANNLDVAVELVHRARRENSAECGLAAARLAIEAIPFSDEVEMRIDGLLTEVPQEIWVAAAERFVREEDYTSFECAIERAKSSVRGSFAGSATMYELIATAAEARSLPTADRVKALKAAGTDRLWARQYDQSRRAFERALELDPDDLDVQFRLADTVCMQSWDVPLNDVRLDIMEALWKLERAHGAGRITTNLSWAYQTEALLRMLASKEDAEDSEEQLWRALIACARSMPGFLEERPRWQLLAFISDLLGMPLVALLFLEHALSLPHDSEMYLEHARILINCGRHREALEILPADQSPYGMALRAYSHLRLGDAEEAVDLLISIEALNPNWFWVHNTLVTALILTGRMQEALQHAEKLKGFALNHRTEYTAKYFISRSSFVLGEFESSGQRTVQSKIDRESFDILVGMANLLECKGNEALKQSFENVINPLLLSDWITVEGPLVKRLAAFYKVPLSSLEEINALAEKCLAKLRPMQDPHRQLELRAEKAEADPKIVACARILVTILLAIASADRDHAAQLFAENRSNLEGRDRELAAKLAEPAVDEDRPDGSDAAAEEPNGSAAEFSAEEAAPEPPIELHLPNCWFDGHDNPLDSHPLFTRFLPEARVRHPLSIPPVKVKAGQELDPDGYNIVLNGTCVESGHVDPAYHYAPREVAGIIGAPGAEPAPFDGDLLQIDAHEQRGPLSRLLSMPAEEVIVRRLERTIAARSE